MPVNTAFFDLEHVSKLPFVNFRPALEAVMSKYADAIAILAMLTLDIRRLSRAIRRVLPAYCDFALKEWTWESAEGDPVPADVTVLLNALVDARPDQLVSAGLALDAAREVQAAALTVLLALIEPPATPTALAA
jgi:hypothetical protein